MTATYKGADGNRNARMGVGRGLAGTMSLDEAEQRERQDRIEAAVADTEPRSKQVDDDLIDAGTARAGHLIGAWLDTDGNVWMTD